VACCLVLTVSICKVTDTELDEQIRTVNYLQYMVPSINLLAVLNTVANFR
jgi:hypothetical protein